MLQGQEILVILLVALVVLGPQRLPELARKLGRWTAELRKAAADIRAGLEAEVGEVREVAEELRRPLKEVSDTMTDARKAMDETARSTKWVGPEPERGPTSKDAMEDLERIERASTVDPEEAPADRADGTSG